jgi:hypothetical protein
VKELLKRIFSASEILLLLAVMSVSMLVRVGLYQRFSRSESMQSTMAWVDSWDYVNYSKAIFNGIFLNTEIDQAESDYYRIDEVPPVYPMILAVFYKVVGYHNLRSVTVLNLLINLLIMYLIYYLAKKLTNSKLALLPALLWGVYINSLVLTGQAIKEPFVTLFILLICLLVYKLLLKPATYHVVLLAIINAVFAHMDERYIFMTVLSLAVVIYIYFLRGDKKQVVRSAAIYTLISTALFIPWQVRNYLRYDRFVLITPRTAMITDPILGYENRESVIADLTAKVTQGQIDSIYRDQKPVSVDSVTANNILKARQYGLRPHYFNIGERIVYNTAGFWQMVPMKPFLVGSGYKIAWKWSLKWSLMVIAGYTIFFFLSLPAFYLAIRKRHFILLFFGAILLVNTLQHAILGAGLVRYRAVMDPLIFIAATYTISQFIQIRNKQTQKKG